jgi:molybdopterin-containing oxidoreductase family iron-sulfur binding subunit
VAKSLQHNKGKSLVVCGINDINVQLLINRINKKLNNINKTIDHRKPSLQYSGSDTALNNLLDDINNRKIGGIIIFNSNPIYTLPQGSQLSESIKKVKLNISISNYNNETSNICKYVAPTPHDLESWNDSELASGLLSMTQPVLQSLGDTRSFRKSLSIWGGINTDERDLVRNYWKQQYKSRIESSLSFAKFWNKLVHDGFAQIKPIRVALSPFMDSRPKLKIEKSIIEYSLYQTPHIAMGRHAENPWLQELPNPITKITWDNYASISERFADKKKLKRGDLITVQTKLGSVTVPVFIQPGQQDSTISIALGYGRKGTERFHSIGPDWLEKKPTVNLNQTVGISVSTLINYSKSISYFGIVDKVNKQKGSWNLAQTQTYDTLKNPVETSPASMPVRPFIQETSFKSFKKDPSSGSHHTHPVTTMWSDDHKYEGHHWGMAIDISACTGCSSCVVSCQVENNIPVVGKDEVLRKRDMAWLRLDRYYSGEGENVDVAFQTMMCQHCDNAPCEPVCPVLATVHSTEGLNQQVYNRCVGTRFCANNCPYKVRRFNWFDYVHEDVMENMVLNPDVTVRSRGVMEKCSMCIQRIQEVRIEAKKNGVLIKDGQIKMACEQSCPADAIVFGDLNDPESKISNLVNSGRHYRVLEELNIQPTVGYLTQVRNRDRKSKKGNHHG